LGKKIRLEFLTLHLQGGFGAGNGKGGEGDESGKEIVTAAIRPWEGGEDMRGELSCGIIH
jgi:hypothetical protein